MLKIFLGSFISIAFGLTGPCQVGDRWPEKDFYYECRDHSAGSYWEVIGCFASWDPMAREMVSFGETRDKTKINVGYRMQCVKQEFGAKWRLASCLASDQMVELPIGSTTTINGLEYTCEKKSDGSFGIDYRTL